MMRPTNPFELWRAGMQVWWLAAEVNLVVGLRLLGMAGAWNTDRRETTRMWTEKPAALMLAARAAGLAASQGAVPVAVMAAAAVPLRRKTRANAARLARLGPGRRRG